MFQAFSVLLLLVALFSVLNYKLFKLPASIGLMIMGILSAIFISLSKGFAPDFYRFFCELIVDVNFRDLLFDGLLSFLLFAGAMHVDYKALLRERKFVISFATVSVLLSTVIVGGLFYLVAGLFGLPLDLIQCLLFGALISPTDPVAVLAILKKSNVSQSLKIKIEGESLFNDGIGVIVYSGILIWYTAMDGSTHEEPIGSEILTLFLEEVVGGLALGALLGFAGFYLIKSCVGNPHLQIILSIALAAGGYAIAQMLHTSGPLAMVVAGIIIGNKLHLNDHPTEDKEQFNNLWEIMDEMLNGVLFLMIGLAIHLIDFKASYLLLALAMIVIVLIARYLSVLIPTALIQKKAEREKGMLGVLTWGGLRGEISLGLAMSLPETEYKELIVLITCLAVVFSVIVQGLSIGKVADRLSR